MNQEFKTLLQSTQSDLFEMILDRYDENILDWINGDFILVRGDAPIMLVAHLDTVHEALPEIIEESANGNILSSPMGIGGDDRCGVYALMKLYENSSEKPWLLFTCEEEAGCYGAFTFSCVCSDYERELEPVKFVVEIDRRGARDSVFYDLHFKEFEDFINSFGFETGSGTSSDIAYIAPGINRAAVNLSSGYYNAHHKDEYIVLSELEDTISKVQRMIEVSLDPDIPVFPYKGA